MNHWGKLQARLSSHTANLGSVEPASGHAPPALVLLEDRIRDDGTSACLAIKLTVDCCEPFKVILPDKAITVLPNREWMRPARGCYVRICIDLVDLHSSIHNAEVGSAIVDLSHFERAAYQLTIRILL